MANNTKPTIRYEILVEGVLDDTWSAWFDGLDVSGDADAGVTSIAGPLPRPDSTSRTPRQDPRSRPTAGGGALHWIGPTPNRQAAMRQRRIG